MNMQSSQLGRLLLIGCFIPLTINTEILDTTFNPGGNPPGTVITAIDTASIAFGVALQTDGKIIAAGTTSIAGSNQFALTRYNPNGSLDTSFGGGTGKVTTLVGNDSFASGVTVQPDGKIVAAGTANMGGVPQFALARYNADGTLDTASFGGGTGIVTTPIGIFSNGNAVFLQPDGKIVVAGLTSLAGVVQVMVARYNPDGTLDTTSFGGGTGIVTTPIDTNSRALGAVLQPDGKIIVAGRATVAGVSQFALARYNPNGTLDTASFGAGTGIVTTPIGTNSQVYGVALQTDGQIVTAGYAVSSGLTQYALARYNTDGTLDTASFGAGTGIVTTPIGTSSQARSVALQTDGQIVTVGLAVFSGITKFTLARYTTDGTLDATFNPSGTPPGTLSTVFDTSSDNQAYALVLQPDTKIVAAGTALIEGNRQFAVARYTTGSPLIQSALTIAIREKYCLMLI